MRYRIASLLIATELCLALSAGLRRFMAGDGETTEALSAYITWFTFLGAVPIYVIAFVCAEILSRRHSDGAEDDDSDDF